jgi:hypothetical protein
LTVSPCDLRLSIVEWRHPIGSSYEIFYPPLASLPAGNIPQHIRRNYKQHSALAEIVNKRREFKQMTDGRIRANNVAEAEHNPGPWELH